METAVLTNVFESLLGNAGAVAALLILSIFGYVEFKPTIDDVRKQRDALQVSVKGIEESLREFVSTIDRNNQALDNISRQNEALLVAFNGLSKALEEIQQHARAGRYRE